MIARLARAWHALTVAPLPEHQQVLIICTGPLPEWMFAAYVAESEREGRPLADILYTALHHQARLIVQSGAAATPKGPIS